MTEKIGSVCPAGGAHEALNRGEEIGAEGFYVPFQVTLVGKKGIWVQQWAACSKCSSAFILVDRVDPLPMVGMGTDTRGPGRPS